MRSLSEDEEFAPAALEAITNVAAELSDRYAEGRIFDRRSINTLRHIINMVVGKQTADWDFLDGGGRLSIENRGVLPGVYLFLEDIRSPYNVGSIFRAAESFGVERIIISPPVRVSRASTGSQNGDGMHRLGSMGSKETG